jgi:carbamoyl-phosphate synthase / aspartate carbamoyltransferase
MLFYEPLTHTGTSVSSEAVMKRRGGDVVSVTAERRSVQKGETLQDTIWTRLLWGRGRAAPS